MAPHFSTSPRGPRALLRQLREIMAERLSGQHRLDRFVKLIAANMHVEVCSIYLRRANGDLELFATRGLAAEAVHRTRLSEDEGLVGLVARAAEPVNLADAARHPRFSYRPETAEENVKSFLGVPILRGGRLLGVLTVQGGDPRRFIEEEVEALQTVAMVLAEIVASGELVQERELEEEDLHPVGPERLVGVGLAEGIGFGRVVFHARPVRVRQFIAEDPEHEEIRLQRGLMDLRRSIDDMIAKAGESLSGVPFDVLDAYRLFAYDRGWASRLREAVASGLTAEAAVERVRREDLARLAEQHQPYFRERRHDLDDLADRMLRILSGDMADEDGELPDEAVIVARAMGPADLLAYDRARLKGVALEEGSASSHVAIVARALDIPVVGRLKGLLERVEPGDQALLDGEKGEFHVRPTEEVREAYKARAAMRSERLEGFLADRDAPCVTRDGVRVELHANVGLDIDLPHVKAVGAEGVGLFRTEIQFLVSRRLPRLREQEKLYAAALDAADGAPVVFRVADLGGDKVLPYLGIEREQNPAMGWRAIRVSLDRPALLRYQLRALLRAARGRELHLLLPMIADVREVLAARGFIEQERRRMAKRFGGVETPIRVGAMIETPSAAWTLDAILDAVDFVAVGTNDLHQFFFAADRGSARLAKRYDSLSPAFLSLMRAIAHKAAAAGKPASVCGMHAGRPLDAMGFVGAGFRKLSMPPAAVGPVKDALRGVAEADLAAAVDAIVADPVADGRALLGEIAAAAGVALTV